MEAVKIIFSKQDGFCGGVKRAIYLAKQARRQYDGYVYIDGELVHNKEVIEQLKAFGIEILNDSDLPTIASSQNDCVIIRAHGCTRKRRNLLNKKFCNVVDATCPHVNKVAEMIAKFSADDINIILVGNKEHPEVISLSSAAKNERWFVVNTDKDIEQLPENLDKICVIAQSTISKTHFEILANKISQIFPRANVINSVCRSSIVRQKSIEQIQKAGAEAIIIVGGKHSNNTLTLVKLAENAGLRVIHVETVDDLQIKKINTFKSIGVIAGASTSNKTIQTVIIRIKKFLKTQKRYCINCIINHNPRQEE